MKETYISSREIIAKVYRDTGHQEELPWPDLIVWTDEALRLVDHPMQFIRKVVGDKSNPALDITDYKAKLPCNIYQIEQIAVDGRPAYRSTGSFAHLISDKCCTVGQSGFQSDLFTDGFGNTFTNNPSGTGATAIFLPVTYDINNDYLTLSVETGKVCIAYLAYPIDEDGFPLIPDVQQYKEMVAKYLTYKLDYRSWRIGEVTKDVFKQSEQDYLWYVGAAAGKMKMPDVDKMQSLMNQVLKLKPNMNAYENFFVDLGMRERKPIQR